MKLTATKTPLLIAAMATAVALTSVTQSNASEIWASADASETAQIYTGAFEVDADAAEIHNANFNKKKFVAKPKFSKKFIAK